MNIPSTHQTVMPYLMLKDAAQFIDFAKQVFNAEITHHSLRDEKLLGHCEMQIGGSTIMFSDSNKDWEAQTANLFIYVKDADETFKKAIDNGATVIMELADQDYGRSGGVTDPFGNIWWITSAQ
jgi:PhnB protein